MSREYILHILDHLQSEIKIETLIKQEDKPMENGSSDKKLFEMQDKLLFFQVCYLLHTMIRLLILNIIFVVSRFFTRNWPPNRTRKLDT